MYIEGFISGFTRKTALGHRSSIHQFLSYKFGFEREGQFCTEEELQKYEQLAKGYFQGKPNFLKDLKGFKEWQFQQRRGPHSISQNIGSVRQWAEYHDLELTSKELRELKRYMPRSHRPVSREDEINTEVIRSLLSHSPPKIKAMVLIMISSGIRIGELSQLVEGDIDMDKNTIYISDIIAKGHEARITFFTDEAKDALKIYLKNRPAYIERARKRSAWLNKEFKEDRVFLATPLSLRDSFNRALKNSGLSRTDTRTSRSTIHPHMLRKYFISWLKLAGCPEDVVEAMAGHSGYLSVAYRRYSESQLREQYRKYSQALVISDYGYDERKSLKEKLSGQADQITALLQDQKRMKVRQEIADQAIKRLLNELNQTVLPSHRTE